MLAGTPRISGGGGSSSGGLAVGTTTITGGNVGDVLTIGAGGLLNSGPVSGTGTVTSVTSANGAATVATQTTTPVITIVSAPKWTTARTLAGNSVDGSANVAFANKFIVQGTADAGLSGAQFLGSLATGILKNTTTTGVLTIAVAADFPTLNQSTTGSAATLTTPRAINGVNFDGSAAITVTAAAGTLTGTTLNATVVTSSLTAVGTVATGTWQGTIVAAAYGGTPFNFDTNTPQGTPLNSVYRLRHSFNNFLSNASFEYWQAGTSVAPSGWTADLGIAVARSATSTTGTYSAQLTFDTSNTGEMYQAIGISTLVNYTFSCYVQRLSGTGTARLVAQRHDSPFTEFASVALPTATGWQLVTLTVNPTAGTQMRFSIKSGSAAASVWLVDECMYQESQGIATAWLPAYLDDTTPGMNIFGNTNFINGLTLGQAGTTLGTLSFLGNTSGNVTVQPAAAAGTWTMTLPTSAGTNAYVLQTDGSGITSWVPQSGSSGSLTVGTTVISGATSTNILYSNAGVLGQYTLTGTGTVVAMQTAPSFLGVITENNNNIGTTLTDGLFLQNSTAAAAGLQQQSPSIHLQGQGWKSAATAASQVMDWQIYVLPIQVAAAATSRLMFSWQNNGGGYATSNNVGMNSAPSSSLPALFFGGTNDPNSGFGSQGSGGFSAYTGGVDTMWWATSGTKVNLKSTGVLGWSTSQPTNGTVDTGLARNGAGILEINSGTAGTFRDLKMRQMLTYQSVTTAGWGVPAIYGSGRVTAQAAANASIATYTVGAADGTFLVSANVNVTTSVTHSFTVTCTYTDETNTSRTLTLSFSQITGTILTSITNVQGVGAYEGVPLHIRCKASTSITVATSAGGTYTSVAYNAEGLITQMA